MMSRENTSSPEPQRYGSGASEASSVGVIARTPGSLRVRGADARDFLQRLSTNDLGLLTADRYCSTTLTTEKAKIIDVVTLFEHGDSLLLITSAESAKEVRVWLQK